MLSAVIQMETESSINAKLEIFVIFECVWSFHKNNLVYEI